MFKRDDVTTSRPASTSLLVIDSEDRYRDFGQQFIQQATDTAVGPYNFKISKNESLMNGFLTRLAVTEIVFPYAVPNVNIKTQTIKVVFTPAGGPPAPAPVVTTITLPIGFYNPHDLASAMETAVIAAGGGALAGFTMTYGDNTQPRFAYDLGSSTAVGVWFEPMAWGSDEYPYPLTTKQLFFLLGFTQLNTVSATSGYGEYTLCQYTRYVDIVCSQLTYNQPLKDTMSQPIARDILCRLYLDQISGAFNANTKPASDPDFTPTGCVPFTIYRNFTSPKQINWTPNQPVPGSIVFQVFDDSGALLSEIDNFDTGSMDWSMTLSVTEN